MILSKTQFLHRSNEGDCTYRSGFCSHGSQRMLPPGFHVFIGPTLAPPLSHVTWEQCTSRIQLGSWALGLSSCTAALRLPWPKDIRPSGGGVLRVLCILWMRYTFLYKIQKSLFQIVCNYFLFMHVLSFHAPNLYIFIAASFVVAKNYK